MPLQDILTVVSIAIVVAAASALLHLFMLSRRYSHLYAFPMHWYFVSKVLFLNINERRRLVLETFKKTGSTMLRAQFLSKVVIIVRGPKLLNQILSNNQDFVKGPFYDRAGYVYGQRFVGNGLFSTRKINFHKANRKIISPVFKSTVLATRVSHIDRITRQFVDFLTRQISSGGSGCERDVNGYSKIVAMPLLEQLYYRLTCQLIFTLDVRAETGDFDRRPQFLDHLNLAVEELNSTQSNPLRNVTTYFAPYIKGNLISSLKYLRSFCRTIVDSHIERVLAQQKSNQLSDEPPDLLEFIIEAILLEKETNGRSGAIFTEEDKEYLIDEALTFFVAGIDTSVNVLCSSLLYVSQYPDLLRLCTEEADQLVNCEENENYQQIPRVITAVFNEALRMCPIAHGLMKESARDVTLDGQQFKRGTVFYIPFWETAVLSTPNGEKFDPLNSMRESHGPFDQIPFSRGQRSCIGQDLAKIEARIILLHMFKNFSLRVEPEHTVEMSESFTVGPADGGTVWIKSRRE